MSLFECTNIADLNAIRDKFVIVVESPQLAERLGVVNITLKEAYEYLQLLKKHPRDKKSTPHSSSQGVLYITSTAKLVGSSDSYQTPTKGLTAKLAI